MPEDLCADLILTDCKVYAADPRNTVAGAVAVKGGRIQRIGSAAEVGKLKGEKTKVLKLGGKLVLPGFVDSHEHCIRKGMELDYVNCSNLFSIPEIVAALKAKAKGKKPGEWVVGTWFDESKMKEGRFPTRYDLDEASKENPIYLGRAGGHNSVANSLALKTAGIGKNPKQPAGGRIEVDDEGEPTGRLDEIAAMSIVKDKIPTPGPEESTAIMVQNWPRVEEELLSWGITSVHEAHIKAPEAQAYQELLAKGRLRMRVGLMLDGMAPYKGYATDDLSRQGVRTGFSWGDKLRVIGVKIGVDGAMGSHTAALKEPYQGEPDNRGIIRVTQEELTDETARCHAARLRVCIHAIGDRAIDVALNAVEEAAKRGDWPTHRHRLEHVGLATPDQIERMKRLGVGVSASIGFCLPIGDSHIDALGPERTKYYYPMRSLLAAGIVTGGNSDGFGVSWALTGIDGCVNRRTAKGRLIGPQEAIPVYDAVKAYTINGAWLEGAEAEKGSIEVGKLADLIILDKDITVDTEHIASAKVLTAIVGGEVVYDRA